MARPTAERHQMLPRIAPKVRPSDDLLPTGSIGGVAALEAIASLNVAGFRWRWCRRRRRPRAAAAQFHDSCLDLVERLATIRTDEIILGGLLGPEDCYSLIFKRLLLRDN